MLGLRHERQVKVIPQAGSHTDPQASTLEAEA